MAPWSDSEECRKDYSFCTQLSEFYDEVADLRAQLAALTLERDGLREAVEAAMLYREKFNALEDSDDATMRMASRAMWDARDAMFAVLAALQPKEGSKPFYSGCGSRVDGEAPHA